MPSANGVSDFSVLQNALKGRSTKIVLVAFDLLYLNGHDLRKLPLFARKAELKQIIDGTAVQFSDSFEIDGQEIARSVRTSRLGSRVSGALIRHILSKTSRVTEAFKKRRRSGLLRRQQGGPARAARIFATEQLSCGVPASICRRP